MKQVTVMVPWNRMVTMDVVTMLLDRASEPEPETCEDMSHDHYWLRPVVLSTWQHTQLGSCPSRSTIIPESQVCALMIRKQICTFINCMHSDRYGNNNQIILEPVFQIT